MSDDNQDQGPSSAQIAAQFFAGPRARAFNEAKTRQRSGNIADKMGFGEYWVRLDKVQMKQTPRKFKTLFEITGVVVHVKSDECEHKVGDSVQHAFFADSDYFFKEVKQFICSVLDEESDNVTEANVLEVCADDNPLADMVIAVKGVHRTPDEGKHKGKTFLNLYWNGEISEEALNDLPENVKATYLPFLAAEASA